MNALIVSPHLDDAALSCAVRLSRGEVGLVATVFAGLPASDAPRSDWDILTKASSARARVAQRRSEDAAAWSSIGIPHLQCDYVESQAAQVDLRMLGDELAAIASGFDHVLLPAGIGRNPDHVLVRDAALLSLPTSIPLTLYGELPYAAFYGWPSLQEYLDVEAHWQNDVADIDPRRCVASPELMKLTDDEKEWKREVLAHYQTQLAAVSGGSLALFETTKMLDYEVEFPIH